ncbi:MAG: hypothetical protein ABJA70_22450 [Chryseolinea sp.]
MKETDEFYIGYFPKAPDRIATVIRLTAVILVISGLLVILVVILFQKKFVSSNFEYGVLTAVTGEIYNTPVPHLSVSLGTDARGTQVFQNIILVSPGKSGADQIVENIFETQHIKEGSLVSLEGFLIYNDGRALLQISEESNEAKVIAERGITRKAEMNSGETIEVSGEIVDPKCYLGVMKPGEGKAHRSCAIRCISGGMPPVLHANNSGDYFLILDQDGSFVNEEILPLVGDQLTLSGEQNIWNDWKILKVSRKTISQMSNLKKINKRIAVFENGISLCDMPE